MSAIFSLPTLHVLIMMTGVFSLLIVVSFIPMLLQFIKPDQDYRELRLRIRTFWWIVILLTLSLFIYKQGAIFFWAIISFLALKEYFTLIPTRRVDRKALFWAYLAIPLQFYWIAMGWYNMFVIFIPVYVFLFMPLRLVLLGETDGFLRSVGTLHWGVMMMVYCLSYIPALYLLPTGQNPIGGTAGLIVYLLFLNQFNDAAQYFWGKLLGKHKIVPQISPNKTVEGFIGGIITTLILAIVLAPWLTPIKLPYAIAIGVIIAVGGFIGDIIMSALKRDLRIKDTSQLLPGHGGILDRIDSLLFTAPLFFHFLRYFVYP